MRNLLDELAHNNADCAVRTVQFNSDCLLAADQRLAAAPTEYKAYCVHASPRNHCQAECFNIPRSRGKHMHGMTQTVHTQGSVAK